MVLRETVLNKRFTIDTNSNSLGKNGFVKEKNSLDGRGSQSLWLGGASNRTTER